MAFYRSKGLTINSVDCRTIYLTAGVALVPAIIMGRE
jgi:hypothetical protein